MTRDIHADLKSQKNALNNSAAWLVLFDVFVSDESVYRLCNNEETVTFGGENYSPFPIGFSDFEESAQGDLPYLEVLVANTDRMLSELVETHKGLLNKEVVMKVIHTSNLTAGVVALESTFMIRETTITDTVIKFRLSHHPFMEVDFPHQVFYRNRCRWKFAGTECGWTTSTGGTGSSETCSKTLDGENGCTAHNNSARFGGFPGIGRRRI